MNEDEYVRPKSTFNFEKSAPKKMGGTTFAVAAFVGVLGHGLLVFLILAFAGAGAGNASNTDPFFRVVVPSFVGGFIAYVALISILFAFGKRKAAVATAWLPGPLVLVGGAPTLLLVNAVSTWILPAPNDFRLACKQAHVRFYKPPSAPVTSVLWRQEPERSRHITFRGYVISNNKTLKSSGTALDEWQPLLSDYVPVFTPLKQSYAQRNAGVPASGFFRQYRRDSGQVSSPSAFDIVVVYTIGPDYSLDAAGNSMPMAKHELVVTDLRTGERLAEMVYVIDQKRGLACGENIPGQANMDVFALQATNLIHSVVQPENYRFRWTAPTTQYQP